MADERPRWLPALVVLAVVVLLASGVLLGPRMAAAGAAAPIELGDAVRVEPEDGWSAASLSSPGGTRAIRLTRGTGSLIVLAVEPFEGSPSQLLDAYADEILPAGVRAAVFGAPDQVLLRSGARAETVGYLGHAIDGTPVEGILVAVVGTADGVVFDARAPQGELAASIDDVRSMISTAEVG